MSTSQCYTQTMQGLSGRMIDSMSSGCLFEPHWRHCFASWSKTPYPLLSVGSTQEVLKIADWDVMNQISCVV